MEGVLAQNTEDESLSYSTSSVCERSILYLKNTDPAEHELYLQACHVCESMKATCSFLSRWPDQVLIDWLIDWFSKASLWSVASYDIGNLPPSEILFLGFVEKSKFWFYLSKNVLLQYEQIGFHSKNVLLQYEQISSLKIT